MSMDHKTAAVVIPVAGMIYLGLGLAIFCQVSMLKEGLRKQGVGAGMRLDLTPWFFRKQMEERSTFNRTVWMILRKETMPDLLPRARRVAYSYAAGIGWLLIIVILAQYVKQ